MKHKIIFLIFIYMLISCKTDRNKKTVSPRIKSFTKVNSPSNNEIIKKGDSIFIEVKSINENNYIINSKVIIKDDTINFDREFRFSSNKFKKYGKKQIKIIRELSNNKIAQAAAKVSKELGDIDTYVVSSKNISGFRKLSKLLLSFN